MSELDPFNPVYFLDECLDVRFAPFLADANRTAFNCREVTGTRAPDKNLDLVASANAWIIVTQDSDYKGEILLLSKRKRRRDATSVILSVKSPRALKRFEQCFPFIEDHLRWSASHGRKIIYFIVHENELDVKYKFDRE